MFRGLPRPDAIGSDVAADAGERIGSTCTFGLARIVEINHAARRVVYDTLVNRPKHLRRSIGDRLSFLRQLGHLRIAAAFES